MPQLTDLDDYRPSKIKVDEFMETDLFTVQKDDLIEMVTDLMEWRKIRYMPVEDTKGRLVGLVTSRLLLRHFSRLHRLNAQPGGTITVRDIMIENPITISPQATVLEAMNLMRENSIGCLPVVKDEELIGMITEMDFLRITERLMARLDK